jgi:D-alanine-D-alanine ligase
MKPRSIACVIDQDILGAVRRGKETNKRAAYDISLVRALRRLCSSVYLVGAVERSSRTIDELARLKPSVIFNLAFSADPFEASFAGALEMLGMPYTGSGAFGIALANDKIRSRQLLDAAGIPVPRFVELPRTRRPAKIDFAPPFIVKPVCLANSSGIRANNIVTTYEQALKRADRIWQEYEVSSVCDQFIVGREFHVAMVETKRGAFKVAAIVELFFAEAEPGRGFKSEEIRSKGKSWRVHPVSFRLAKLPQRKMSEIAEATCAAANVLDLRGYAKVDLRMDDEQRITVIEANANPGLLSTSVFWRHPSFEANLTRIMDAAVKRSRE